MRFDPFREIDRLTQQLAGTGAPAMPMDAYRRQDEVLVHFDLPGIRPESIEVTVDRDVLTVSAERRWEPEGDAEVLVSERPQGKFSRQVFLGESLDTEHIEAGYDAGVLTVRVPVAASAKPRRVEITTGHGQKELANPSAA